MADEKTGKAAQIVNEFWKEAYAKRAYIPSRQNKLGQSHFEKGASTGNSWVIKQDVVAVPPNFLISLTPGELKMVCKIISELKRSNLFWYYDYRIVGGKEEKVIGTLRGKRVLFKTENLTMHLVNPLFIRRGAIDSAVASTAKLIEDSKEINKKLYKHLSTPDRSDVNAYFKLLDG